MKSLALLFLLFLYPVTACAENLDSLQNAPPDTDVAPERKVIRLPNGETTRIVEFLDNGDIRLENGLVLTPEGYILEGELAGQRIAIPEKPDIAEMKEEITREQNLKEVKKDNIPLPSEKSAGKDETSRIDQHEDAIAEILTSLAMAEQNNTPPSKEKTALPEKKKPAPVKKEKPVSPKKEETRKKPVAEPRKRLYIPPESAKSGNLNFLDGCWAAGSIIYTTKRKVSTCVCFNANGQGNEKVYDPGHTGTSSGSARAKMRPDGTLSIHSAPKRTSRGQVVFIEQVMICRNKGKTAFCTEDFLDGRRQSFETHFARVPSCPR